MLLKSKIKTIVISTTKRIFIISQLMIFIIYINEYFIAKLSQTRCGATERRQTGRLGLNVTVAALKYLMRLCAPGSLDAITRPPYRDLTPHWLNGIFIS